MEESKKEKRSLQEKGITFPEKVCLTELGFLFVCFLMLSGKPRQKVIGEMDYSVSKCYQNLFTVYCG